MGYNENLPWRPYYSVWELTMACNMRCLHCGSYAGKPREDELSQERALQLVDELVELRTEKNHSLGRRTSSKTWMG
jgi:MoaA/NifB/PqqE/SkfB family radical SAM enzyme